jgi:hypothetical protein
MPQAKGSASRKRVNPNLGLSGGEGGKINQHPDMVLEYGLTNTTQVLVNDTTITKI